MALNINAYNTKPDVGDAYTLAYRAHINASKPWTDYWKGNAKIAGDLGAAYLNALVGDTDLEDPEVEVEGGDAELSMNGIDPFLMRRYKTNIDPYKDLAGNEVEFVNPFDRG